MGSKFNVHSYYCQWTQNDCHLVQFAQLYSFPYTLFIYFEATVETWEQSAPW